MYNVRTGCETYYISFSHNMVGNLVLISLNNGRIFKEVNKFENSCTTAAPHEFNDLKVHTFLC